MSKINEYPQAVTINNNDLFVIDQESGGDHATKSASVSQIADKATSGVQTQIGDLSQLTTSVTSSLVGAVNEVVTGLGTKAKITRKKYSVTLTSNSYLAPFTYFNRLDVGSDTLIYGTPIGVWANNAGVTPHIENSNSVDFLGGSAITCDVYVFFASNVDVIS